MANKREFNQAQLKRFIIVNMHEFGEPFDSYDGYFYIDEKGEPIFVIEKLTRT